MPTYEYECQKCGHTFDVFQSMTDERIKRCPKCRGKVIRLFGTGSGIIFKGSGFYETDYRRKESGTGNGKKTVAAKDSDSSTTDSSKDTKAEKKKDSTPADTKRD